MNNRKICRNLFVIALFAVLMSGAAFAESFTQNQIKDVFTDFKSYDFGKDPASVHKIHKIVRFLGEGDRPQLRSFTEKQMILLLESDETSHRAKQIICQELCIIGSDACIPVLEKMLLDTETCPMACYALYTYPSDAVDLKLRQALDRVTGESKVNIINVLGSRKDARSVDLLIPLLDAEEDQIAWAAARALGKIGGDKVAATIKKARVAASGVRHAVLTEAYMNCAEVYVANEQSSKAFAIYTELLDDSEQILTRRGALVGVLHSGHSEAVNTMIDTIKRDEPILIAAAIANSVELKGAEVTQQLISVFKKASTPTQVQLINALAQRDDPLAKSAITSAVSSKDANVRMAAFNALAEIGEAADIALLCNALEQAETEAEVNMLKVPLQRIQGEQVSREILEVAKNASPSTKVHLIQIMTSRRYDAAVPELLAFCGSDETSVVQASLRAISTLSSYDDIPDLLDVYVGLESQAQQSRALSALAGAIGRNDQHQEAMAKLIQGRLDGTTAIEQRRLLLQLLSYVPNELSLQRLKEASEDPDSSVRYTAIGTLAKYPEPTATDVLLDIFQTSSDSKYRAVALRGCVRLLKTGKLSPEQTIEVYEQLIADISEPAEKKLVLSGLAVVLHPAALELIKELGTDESVKAEADFAYKALADTMMPVVIGFNDSSTALDGKKGDAKLVDSPISGKALSLDGTNARVELPLTEKWSVGSEAFTVSMWVQPKSLRQSGIVCLGGYGWRHGWFVDACDNGSVRLQTSNAEDENNGSFQSPAGSLKIGRWTHIAVVVTRGDDKARIYIDGEKKALGKIGAVDLTNPEANVVIGGIETKKNNNFHGVIDEVSLTKQVLTDDEIRRMAKRGPKLAAIDAALEAALAKEPEKKRQELLKPPPQEQGYESIFDGKTFTGWEGNLDWFRIEDGAIVAGTFEKKIPNNMFLCTTKEYTDFQLKLKIKLVENKGNAGIQIRSQRIPNHHEVIGYQADAAAAHWGALYDESRRKRKLDSPSEETVKKAVKVNDWNEYIIRCEGKRVQFWINDIKTVDFTETDASIPRTGVIGLQIHGGPPAEAWYKDIQIKELLSVQVKENRR